MIGYIYLSYELFSLNKKLFLTNFINPLKQIFEKVIIYSPDRQLTTKEIEVIYNIPKFDGKPSMLVVPIHYSIDTEKFKNDQTTKISFNNLMYVGIDEYFNINDIDYNTIYDLTERFKTKLKASVLVFDLDDTIIDKECNLFGDDLPEALNSLKGLYDYIGIWSHGSTNHVFKNIKKIFMEHNIKFDFVITRDDKVYNKSVIHVLNILNKKFSISELTFSCLVDDKFSNYNYDYSLFVHLTRNPENFTSMSDFIIKNTRKLIFDNSQ